MENKADIVIGLVKEAKGVKGEVKFSPYLRFAGSPKGFPCCLLWKKGETEIVLSVRDWREEIRFTVVSFEGIENRDDAEALKGGVFLVAEEFLPPLNVGEYYWFQLVDMNVVSDSGKHVGRVKEIMETGGHDVYVVERPSGEEVLIPGVKEFVLKIDHQERRITVRYMEGLW